RLAFQERDLFDPRRIRRTPGRDIGVVFEGVVNDAPLIGIHRLELQRASGDAYSLSQLANALHNSIFAHGAIMRAIDNELLVIFWFVSAPQLFLKSASVASDSDTVAGC